MKMKRFLMILPMFLVIAIMFSAPKPVSAKNFNLCHYAPILCYHPTSTPSPSLSPSPSPSVSPSVEPSFEPSWTPSPSASPSSEPSPTVEVSPSVDPSSTPAPSDEPQGQNGGFSAPDPQGPPPVCQGSKIEFAPTVIEVERIDADSVRIKWSPVDGHIHNYMVQYSLAKGFFMWNTVVKDATETTLNLLPSWLPIWVRVAGTDDCIVGNYGEWVDP